MESTQQFDRETYRTIVFRHDGSELLLAPATGGFLLPSVEIPRWQRITEHLVAAMKNNWGHKVVCLFNPDVTAAVFSATDHNYQVMDYYGPVAEPRPRAEWVRVASLSKEMFSDPADYLAVQRSLAKCAAGSDDVTAGPFARLGWFKELQLWIKEVIEPLRYHLTEKFAQLNASPSFSLVRFETSGPFVWFKATGKPNLREFPITIALAKLFPQYLPTILAARPDWNGWLALEVEGTNLGETHDTRDWNVAASALAKLQIESIGRRGTLIDSGVRCLGASALSKLIRPFLDVIGQLMEKQTKVPPPVLSKKELTLLGEQIEAALTLSTHLGIPDALGHLDLNPGNVILSDRQCVFLDWAEAHFGTPILSFQYLIEHFRRIVGLDPRAEAGLISAYSGNWHSLVSPESLAAALACAPMLAVFAYAAGNNTWNDQVRLQDTKVAGYLRGLTRRIHREATRLRDWSAICPC